MILYHGTSSLNIDNIKQKGLLPRKFLVELRGRILSHPDFVYLTSLYPLYYAINSCKNLGITDWPTIFRINVDKKDIFPDEMYIANILKNKRPHLSYKEIAESVREFLPTYKKYAEMSLKEYGNCCCRSVNKSNIIDYITIFDINTILIHGNDIIYPKINALIKKKGLKQLKLLFK